MGRGGVIWGGGNGGVLQRGGVHGGGDGGDPIWGGSPHLWGLWVILGGVPSSSPPPPLNLCLSPPSAPPAQTPPPPSPPPPPIGITAGSPFTEPPPDPPINPEPPPTPPDQSGSEVLGEHQSELRDSFRGGGAGIRLQGGAALVAKNRGGPHSDPPPQPHTQTTTHCRRHGGARWELGGGGTGI